MTMTRLPAADRFLERGHRFGGRRLAERLHDLVRAMPPFLDDQLDDRTLVRVLAHDLGDTAERVEVDRLGHRVDHDGRAFDGDRELADLIRPHVRTHRDAACRRLDAIAASSQPFKIAIGRRLVPHLGPRPARRVVGIGHLRNLRSERRSGSNSGLAVHVTRLTVPWAVVDSCSEGFGGYVSDSSHPRATRLDPHMSYFAAPRQAYVGRGW